MRKPKADGGDHHGGFDAQALPDDGDVARPVGEPDDAGRDQRDQGQVEKDADHRARIMGAVWLHGGIIACGAAQVVRSLPARGGWRERMRAAGWGDGAFMAGFSPPGRFAATLPSRGGMAPPDLRDMRWALLTASL